MLQATIINSFQVLSIIALTQLFILDKKENKKKDIFLKL